MLTRIIELIVSIQSCVLKNTKTNSLNIYCFISNVKDGETKKNV